MNDCQRHAVAGAARWIAEGSVVVSVLGHPLAHASGDTGDYAVAIDEALDVGSEFGEVFSPRRRLVPFHGAVDNTLRQARIEIAARALADENVRIALGPEVTTE